MSNPLTNLVGNNESSLEAAIVVSPKKGMILTFQPLTMSFENVKYFVDMPPLWNLSHDTSLLCDPTVAIFVDSPT
jgi:hypothetical protein